MALISDNGISKYLWNQWKHTLCSPEMYHDDLKCFNPMLLISTTSFQRAQTSWKKWSYFIRYQISMSVQLSFELSLNKSTPRWNDFEPTHWWWEDFIFLKTLTKETRIFGH